VTGSVNHAGCRAAYAIAEDNLRHGRVVIGDSVNGWPETRDAWQSAAVRSDAQFIEVEILCSDLREDRRRVETRHSDISGLVLPDWQAVISRDYQPWGRDHLTIDTVGTQRRGLRSASESGYRERAEIYAQGGCGCRIRPATAAPIHRKSRSSGKSRSRNHD
jgi:predicted kinase